MFPLNYNNQARVYENMGDFETALSLYEKTDNIPLKEYNIKTRVVYYNNRVNAYEEEGDYENALLYSKRLLGVLDSIDDSQQNIAISKIKEQYDNEKLRADNLEAEVRNKEIKNWLIIALSLLVLGSITFFFIQKNTKRKQLLAEQEKQLETQKVTTLLKEQELTAIDAMIEGQEKERQRIANDLHDDLGGMMTTVKLHFEALKNKPSSELYDKTSELLNTAYEKVRSVAHSKNSGVMANKGLLKSHKRNGCHHFSIQSIADRGY